MVVQICVGSSCFLRGAPEAIKQLQELVAEHGLAGAVTLKGSFCMEQCAKGVTVKIGDKLHTGLAPADVPRLFETEILPIAKG